MTGGGGRLTLLQLGSRSIGPLFVFIRPPLFWPWEGSNYPSRSSDNLNGPKGTKLKKKLSQCWNVGRDLCARWQEAIDDTVVWVFKKLCLPALASRELLEVIYDSMASSYLPGIDVKPWCDVIKAKRLTSAVVHMSRVVDRPRPVCINTNFRKKS